MTEQELLAALHAGPVDFATVMAHIDSRYIFTPCAFENGELCNAAGQNNGSCKVFAFAKRLGLPPQATLNAFGEFYTGDVLGNPDGSDHGNIRNFMVTRWAGLRFFGEALAERPQAAQRPIVS